MSTDDYKTAAMDGIQSAVSFKEPDEDGENGWDEEALLADTARTRMFSVSKDRPITRIPTRVEMKTLTHKAKRPAVDIEFHDLTYAVNTTAGNLLPL